MDLNTILINLPGAYKIGSAERAFKWSSADTTSCSSDPLLEMGKVFYSLAPKGFKIITLKIRKYKVSLISGTIV